MKTCNVCEQEIPNFVEVGTDYECPLCRSLTRHRALVKQFSGLWTENPNVRVADIGPHPSIFNRMWKDIEKVPTSAYMPMDIRPWSSMIVKIDLARHTLQVAPCDIIMCVYVLDQVVNDAQALANLALSIKQGGKLIFDAPFKDGDTDRDELIPAESERVTRFGSALSLRLYGRGDIQALINGHGFTSEWVTTSVDESIGINTPYSFIVGTKT